MIEQARELDDGTGFVFPTWGGRVKPMSNMAMMTVLRRNGLADRTTVHAFRATFRTWAEECTSADHAVKELSLGHAVGTKVERANSRSELLEQRREFMEARGRFATGFEGESGQ